MRGDLFAFLRATFYRWAQIWPDVCDDLRRGPRVLAVGDLDVDNSFRSGHAVRQRCVATILPLESSRAEHERKGNRWDNAVAESFFCSLKKERIKKQIYKNRELAVADVAYYIDSFYIQRAAIVISVASVRSNSKRLISRFERVSTESWELQSLNAAISRPPLAHLGSFFVELDRSIP